MKFKEMLTRSVEELRNHQRYCGSMAAQASIFRKDISFWLMQQDMAANAIKLIKRRVS